MLLHQRPALYAKSFLLFKKWSEEKESNFSVKSEALMRKYLRSYTKSFLFVLSFNVAPYFPLKKLVIFIFNLHIVMVTGKCTDVFRGYFWFGGRGYAGGSFHGGTFNVLSMEGAQDFLALFKKQ